MTKAKFKPHDRHPQPSGMSPTYVVDPKTGRIARTVYRCSCHGLEFESSPILRMHVSAFRKSVQRDFSTLVSTNGLGQEAWTRLPGESPLQHKRFMCYLGSLDGKLRRSVDRASAIMNTNPNLMRKTSAKWHWVLRAQLFDAHIEAEEFREFEAQKRQSARRQAVVGRKLQDVALSAATRLLGDDDRMNEMSGNEIAKLADVGTKIERLANSDPTAISEDRGQVKLVWEGPRPAWAPPEFDAPHPPTIEAGPLTRQVGGAARA